ncbi:M48 family metallopeptidase [Desulfurella sp.]|uniref:M48 family metallopeptidase n=1 Tax=Desulfurella sp. TaxID=1962857 RepID=UPI003D15146C
MQIQIVYSKRKTISLIITKDANLLVRAPFGTNKSTIIKIIQDKKAWIERKIDEIKKHPLCAKKDYIDGEKFYYLGKIYELKISNANKNSVFLSDGKIFILLKKQSSTKTVLINWYKEQALNFIKTRLNYYSNLLNCTFKSVNITSAKKRLGSCDFNGNLRFSFYNILLDQAYIDYVVIHELCHLFYLNHSKNFWQKVESIMPDFKQKRLWIRKNFYIIANSL